MNRTIKFRGLNPKTNELVYGDLIQTPENKTRIIGFNNYITKDEYQSYVDYNVLVNENTIGQYIGLSDVNDKEIFEGDILVENRYPYYSNEKLNYVGIVEFKYSSWKVVLKCVNKDKYGISDGLTDTNIDNDGFQNMEIIGNIYQNSELLEAK
jgi:uncharacterized phage protein (TIGR01671 family)